MLQIYLLYFDIEQTKIVAEVLSLQNADEEQLEWELNKLLQSESYDFFDYSDDIAILVDDRGFEKVNNPVFEIVSEFGDTSHLAGRLVFVRNVENEFSIDFGSIEAKDVLHLRENLYIKLVGLTKGM